MIRFSSKNYDGNMRNKDLNVRYISNEAGLPLEEYVRKTDMQMVSPCLGDDDVMERRQDKCGTDCLNGNVWYEVFDKELYAEQCNQVVSELQVHLTSSPLKHPNLTLCLPPKLLPRIAKDIVFLSQGEPCGLRGCTLIVNVQKKYESYSIAKIEFDPSIVSTFELHLTLPEDRKHWLTPFKDFLHPVVRKYRGEQYCHQVVISSAFQMAKRKLYRNDPKKL